MRLSKEAIFIVLNLVIATLCYSETFAQQIVINERPSLDTLSNPYSTGVDPRMINAAMSVPINVPPGINGVQPNLVIFNNSNSQNGILGVGWDMAVDSIERSTKRGAPKYNSADTFVLVQSGSAQDLVYDSACGIYHPETEDAFKKIEFLTDHWVITDRQGTRYFFGATSDSRQYDPSAANNVYKWFMNRVEDVHGNFMTITYTKDNNQNYLQKVEYTGNQNTGLVPFAQVEFELADRFVPYRSYRGGFLVQTLKRIAAITVKAQGALVRKYELNYTQSRTTSRDLLSSIKQYGADGTTSLPPTVFTYYDNDKGFQETSASIPAEAQFSKLVSGRNADLGVRMVDVNGDGYADILKNYIVVTISGPQRTQGTYINNKNNTWSSIPQWNMPDSCFGGSLACGFIFELTSFGITSYIEVGLRVADINGDGRMDIIHSLHSQMDNNGPHTSAIHKSAYLNSGAGWTADSSSWYLPPEAEFMSWYTYLRGSSFGWKYEFLGNLFADVNDDGYVDIVTSKKAIYTTDMLSSTVSSKNTYLNNIPNNTTGWSLSNDWVPPNTDYTNFAAGAELVDLNGDNLPDIFYRVGGTGKVYMNTGRGWQEDASSPWLNTLGYGDSNDGSTQIADINGDGLVDLIIAKGSYANGSRVLINTGNGWLEDSAWAFPAGEFANLGLRLLDSNADGLLDFMIHYNGQAPRLFLNLGKPADLLKTMDNSFGGLTTIEYDSSAHFSNTFLPFSLPVITAVTRSTTLSNGQGNSYTTRFSYANGLWVAAEREFYGFGFIKVTDPEGNYTETTYLQDSVKKGKIAGQKTYDSTGKLLTQLINTWDSRQIVPGVNFVFLSQKDSLVFGGDSTSKRSQEKYFYEEPVQLGNLTKTIQLGEVNSSDGSDLGSDKRTVETTYLNNTAVGKWLIGFPNLITVKNNNDELMRKTWLYYDNQDNLIVPIKGLLTKKEEWAGDQPGAVNPLTTITYDSFGNPLTTTDPRSKTTSITYDPAFHLFPLSTKNHLNHVVSQEYYGVNGVSLDSGDGFKGLWGQLKSTTDANNQKTRNTYDVFGRTVARVLPLDTISFPTTSYQYQYAANYLKTTVSQRINHGQAGTLDSFEYADGLGRVIQTKSPSAQAGQFIVGGQTKYNSRGLPSEKYLPFFSTNSVDTIEVIDSARAHSVISYDALGRVIKSVNPDGTYSTVEYDKWTTRNIDENGHKQESDFDAFGKLVQKREYTGADGRFSPVYPSVSYFPYATTQYSYDSEGNLVNIADTDGKTTTIAYDKLGRKISMDDPDMGLWHYQYDLNGNLTVQTDAKNHTINFSYDDINRLKLKSDGAGLNNSYTYDDQPNAVGRLTAVTFSGGDRRFEYDALGRTKQVFKTINGTSYHLKYEYNAQNDFNNIEYPDNYKAFYKYNSAGQPEGVARDSAFLGPQSFNFQPQSKGSSRIWEKIKTGLTSIKDEVLSLFIVEEAYAQVVPLDYTTFTEQDPGNKVTLTANCVSYSNVETQQANTFVFRNYPTQGDFTYEFDGILTSTDSMTAEAVIWGVSNSASETWDDWSDGLLVAFSKGATTPRVWLESKSGGSSQYNSSVVLNTRYYFRVQRQGNVVTLQIYSNASRTTLVGTLSLTVTTLANYQYLYAFDTQDSIITSKKASGDVCRLTYSGTTGDTQAPTAPTTVALGSPTASSLNLTWSGSTDNVGVTGYRIDVSTSATFSSFVSGYNNLDVGNVASKSITGLNASTTYYARVRAYDAVANVSANSSAANGTTTAAGDTQAPAAPTTVTLGSPTKESLNLSWSGATDNVGVTGYRVDVSSNSNFTSFVTGYNNVDAGSVSSSMITGLNANTTYYARVRAYDMAGNVSANSSTASGATTAAGDTQAPAAPTTVTLGSPTNESLNLSWSGATDNVGVTGYRVDVSSNSNFTSFVTGYNNVDAGSVSSSMITGLNANMTYYARVRAYDMAGNVSANSSTASGTTSVASDSQAPTAPTTVTLGTPTSNSLSLSWSGATDNIGVTGYRIDVSTNSAFTTILSGYDNLNVGNVSSNLITGLNANTSYYARVRAYDGAANVSANSLTVSGSTSLADTQAPSAPSTITLGSPTANSLNLTWSASTDNVAVTGYRVDVSTSSTFTSFVSGFNNLNVNNVLSKTITGLTAGTTYYARVRAYDAAANISTNSATANGMTVADAQAPSAPTTITLGSPTTSSLRLSWSGATDNVAVTGYRVDVSTTSAFTSFVTGYNNLDVGNVTSKSITSLDASTTYYARVRAYDESVNISANSSTASGTTSVADTQAPTAPTTVTLGSPTTSSLNLSWSGATDNVAVTGYRVDVSTTAAFTSFVSGYSNLNVGNVSSKLITGLSANTSYYARVRADDAAVNVSANSSTANGTTSAAADTQAPTAPTTVSLGNPTANSLNLTWTASTDNVAVTGYRVDVSTTSAFTTYVTGYNNLDVGNVSTKSITGLNANTSYYARVRAYDAAANVSANSSTASGTTSAVADTQAPTAPATVSLGSPTANSLNLTWTASTDNVAVTGYRVDVSTSSAFTSFVSGFNNLDVGNVASKSITGLSANTPYYARVRAYDAATNVSSNSITANGTTSAAGDTQAPTVPGNATLGGATVSSLNFTWTASTDNVAVVGYRIDVATDSAYTSIVSGYNNLDVGNVVSKVITGLNPDTTYYARLRAYDAAGNVSGNSSFESEKTLEYIDTVPPAPPTTVTLGTPTTTSLVLNWAGASDNVAVTGYRVDVSTNSGFTSFVSGYNNVNVNNVLTRTVTGLTAGTTYYARVRAYDAASNVSINSATATGTTTATPDTTKPSAPSNVSLTNATANSLTLNWSASTDNVGVAGYRVDVATNSTFTAMVSGYNNLDVGNVLSRVISGLNANTRYYVRARAYDAAGNVSANSASKNAWTLTDAQAPTAPAGTAFTNPTTSSLTLSWNASTDNVAVTGYRIDVSTNDTFTALVSGYSNLDVGNVLTKTITGLSANTPYYARVRAYDGAANVSANSVTASGTTASPDSQAPTAPTTATLASPTSSSLSLSWSGATDNIAVTGYRVDVSTNDTFSALVSGYNNLDVGNVLTKTITGLSDNTPYYARVRAYDAGANVSANSPTASATTLVIVRYALSVTKAGTGLGTVTSNPAGINCGATCSANFVEGTVVTVSQSPAAGAAFAGWSGACTGTSNCQVTVSAAKSLTATFNDTAVPTVPGGLTATAGSSTAINLAWNAASDTGGANLKGYKVYKSNGSSFVFLKEVTAPATTTSDVGLTPSTSYSYKVASVDNAGNESAQSAVASATTQAPPPISQPYVRDIQYNAAGLKTLIEYGNGVISNFTYDANLRLKTILTKNAANVFIQDLNYEYDGVGNIIRITDGVNQDVKSFVYDELNRLVQAAGEYGTAESYVTLAFAYAANGNITQKDNLAYTYAPDGLKPHAVRAVGPETFNYDANGNMVTKVAGGVTTGYDYDAENRLSAVRQGATVVAQYKYDDTGERTQKTAASVTTNFVGDLFEDSSLADTSFIFIAGARVAAVEGGALKYYHADHLGGTNAVTDSTGAVVDRAEYKPFGEFAAHTALDGEGPFFTDQYRDAESDLYYYGARYYNPRIGRFITPDWVVQAPANSQSLNRYTYALNNPINRIDPSGNISWESGSQYWQKWSNFVNSNSDLSNVGDFGVGFAGSFVGLKDLPGGLVNFASHPIRSITAIPGALEQLWGDLTSADTSARTIGALTGDAIIGVLTGNVLSKAQGSLKSMQVLRDPKTIRFSQDSIKLNFSDGRNVLDMANDLKSGAISAKDIPPIRIVERGGNLISIDNRRLFAFREANLHVRTQFATVEEILEAGNRGKFSAGPLGTDTVRIRGGR